jgi:GNAT superfamily N-acetyltransferase
MKEERVEIEPYGPERREELLTLSVRAWRPVLAQLRSSVPAFVYDSFYPQGWQRRQVADIARILDEEPNTVRVAVGSGIALGWVCTRLHPEDQMGEIYVLAVDPAHQRQGVATALMNHAFDGIRGAGMAMVMVETGGDRGHAASRASYESMGFERWPVARYFKDLTSTPRQI